MKLVAVDRACRTSVAELGLAQSEVVVFRLEVAFFQHSQSILELAFSRVTKELVAIVAVGQMHQF